MFSCEFCNISKNIFPTGRLLLDFKQQHFIAVLSCRDLYQESLYIRNLYFQLESPKQLFSCEICEIFKNTFFHRKKAFFGYFYCFPFILFIFLTALCQKKANPRTLSHLNLKTYSAIIHNATQIQCLKFQRGSKSNRNSCQKLFLQMIVPDSFCTHFRKLSLPQE